MSGRSLQVPGHGTLSLTPALTWQFGHMTGNGEMGVIQYGPPEKERIVLSQAELFMPLGSPDFIPDMAPYLDEVRRISRTEGYRAGHDYFIQKGEELGHTIVLTDPFHPALTFVIEQEEANGAGGYSRSVNYATGEITSSCDRFTHQLFASRPDGCVMLRISSSVPLQNVRLSIEEAGHPGVKADVQFKGETWNGIHSYEHGGGYRSKIEATHNGEARFAGGCLIINGATWIELKMKVAPEIGSDFLFSSGSYAECFERHKKKHEELFYKASLDLNGGERRSWSGEALLNESKETGILHPALIEKCYDAGRYMFLCSAGSRPPNLQGIWTGTFDPPWSSDYTMDTNLQLGMASVFSANMLHGMEPYTRLLESYMEDFRYNARRMFGCRGILAGVCASSSGLHTHWGDSSWGDRECDTFFGAFWTCGAGWLAHWLFDYYQYTGDLTYLHDHALPFMKEAALFYEDFLIEVNGKLLFLPSYSAENGIAANSTMDIAVVRELLTNMINASILLEMGEEDIPRWQEMLGKLPLYELTEEGALKEWAVDDHEENDDHRHFSHLYPLFQSYEFSPEKTPVLWKAAEKAYQNKLKHWVFNPDTDTSSHGRMHAALCAARLGDGKTIAKIMKMMLSGGAVYPSFMTAHFENHHVFNVDANGAFPELIQNAALFSLPGRIELLPALPAEMSEGMLKGMLCRGGLTVIRFNWNVSAGIMQLIIKSSTEQDVVFYTRQPGWSLNEEEGMEWIQTLPAEEPIQLEWRRSYANERNAWKCAPECELDHKGSKS
ncbi:glycosyl hydrolase family 95 catalytic domain-containing protein [Jeotgalibacillus campisalis]|uniref:Uncharacterized protein n=1 Tax=Jeotgalibacillus campisalis TaxID=220754 RepID=A0A0C2VHP6_9BACL|nr:glycoside hydrolase N-terminal domain-containing protein [Jeotgalibacillus campisalis]KIL48402.1 hypothetical protein KR50_14380 [Jeotgalibacillus campisalis]